MTRSPIGYQRSWEPAERGLDALEALVDRDGPFLLGDGPGPTLADLHMVAMLACTALAPTGARLLADRPRLSRWWTMIGTRPSVQATRFPAETPP